MVYFKYSVVIPTLNRPDQLCITLDSVLQQPLDGELEIVVIDNFSAYDINALLADEKYASVRLIQQPVRVSRIDNFMTALKAATGEYLAILFDDEEMLADNLLRKAQVMDAHPEVVAVTSSVVQRSRNGDCTPGMRLRPGVTIETRAEYLSKTFAKVPGGMPQVLMRRWAMDHLVLEQRDEPLDADAFVLRLSTLGSIATLPDALVTETASDAEMVKNGLLEPFEVPDKPGKVVNLPTLWFGWSHYRMRVEHLLTSPDLSNKQIRQLQKIAFEVLRRDVWKAVYLRWRVARKLGPGLTVLNRATAYDFRLLVPPLLYFLRWKLNNATAVMPSNAVLEPQSSAEKVSVKSVV